ncbi:nose resistant to fluoxetine protein 6-like [Ptychodera flava]|uniref:nose resistant to fluoxetine protein 6-like n=1 Tax=Ptychodera flava TaxID=63121 RepID=UPI003969DF6F
MDKLYQSLCILFLSISILPCNAVIPLSSLKETYARRAELAMTRSSLDTPVSQKCLSALHNALVNKTSLLVTMIDASGKIGAGFTDGNMGWLGSFELCRNFSDLHYCHTQLPIHVSMYNATVPVQWGLCTVTECNETDVANTLDLFIGEILGTEAAVSVPPSGIPVACAKDPPKPHSIGFYLTVVLCCILASLMLIGWFLDIYLQYAARRRSGLPLIDKSYQEDGGDDETAKLLANSTRTQNGEPHVYFASNEENTNFLQEFFLCFALNRNVAKIMDTSQPKKAIRCLHGIRVLSMLWVILGHSFLWHSLVPLDNYITGSSILKDFTFQVINNAFFSVDTFFFLSGLLVTYLAMDTLERTNGRLPWFKFYFHRYWRLTPTLAMAILLWMYIHPWTGQGPLWFTMLPKPYCEKYWWSTLLYINNFVPNSLTEECIGWTWYLANDWQFYVITPLIILPLFKSATVGFGILFTVLSASFAVTGAIMGHYGFVVNFLSGEGGAAGGSNANTPTYPDYVYIKPYCRIAPYLVGMAVGYALQKIRTKSIKISLSPIWASLAWALATAIGVTVVYGLYGTTHGHELSQAGNIMYAMFSRFAWGIALAWVVFACQHGLSGAVNDLLSSSFWIPLSRLTYTAYLLHPMVLDFMVFQFTSPAHFKPNVISFHFVGVAAVSYAVGLLLSMAVEYPTANLEKLIQKRITCSCCFRKRNEDNKTGSIQH